MRFTGTNIHTYMIWKRMKFTGTYIHSYMVRKRMKFKWTYIYGSERVTTLQLILLRVNS